MKRFCSVCRFWTDHTARRHTAKPRRTRVEQRAVVQASVLRAYAWLWFWGKGEKPDHWRAASFDLVFGDRAPGMVTVIK